MTKRRVYAALAAVALAGCAPKLAMVRTALPDGAGTLEIETRDGQPHGLQTRLDRFGEVVERGHNLEGARHGLFERFADGQVVERRLYHRGQLVWRSERIDQPVPAGLAGLVTEATRDAPAIADVRELVDDAPRADPMFLAGDRIGGPDQASLALAVGSLPRGGSAQRVVLGWQQTVRRALGYAKLTTTYAEIDGDRAAGRRTLELGGGGRVPLARGARSSDTVFVRGGLVIPVGHDDAAGYGIRASSTYADLAAAVGDAPRALGLRSSGSLYGRRGGLSFRVDAGLDLALDLLPAHEEVAASTPFLVLARLGASVGWRRGPLGLAVELINVAAVTDEHAAERLAHALSAGLRLAAPLAPSVRLMVPLDGDDRDRWAAIAGLDLDLEAP